MMKFKTSFIVGAVMVLLLSACNGETNDVIEEEITENKENELVMEEDSEPVETTEANDSNDDLMEELGSTEETKDESINEDKVEANLDNLKYDNEVDKLITDFINVSEKYESLFEELLLYPSVIIEDEWNEEIDITMNQVEDLVFEIENILESEENVKNLHMLEESIYEYENGLDRKSTRLNSS